MYVARRLFPAMRVFSFILIVIAGLGLTRWLAPQPRPNVLLIMTDDQGWGDLSSHGNPMLKTPVLDSLARQSAQFERFYVSPLCAPTRASLLTGRYHLRTGTVSVTKGLETMRADETTLAEIFRANGYRTGIFGKWHNGEHYPNTPAGQGFDEFLGFCAGHWSNYFSTELQTNRDPVKTTGYITNVLTDAALSFVDRHQREPFFCYVPYNAPHSPHQVPDDYFDPQKAAGHDNELASIYGMVVNIDHNVGRLLRRLDGLKLTDNTIVIFLTDNGPNGHRYNGGMKGIKASVDEGGMRVPCFVRWPGHIRPGLAIKSIAAHIDVLPTLVALCGLQKLETLPLDGVSMAGALLGTTNAPTGRTLFSHVAFTNDVTQLKSRPGTARTDRYRLVWNGAQPELYDMLADPNQTRDVAAYHSDQTKQLADAYTRWFADVTAHLQPAPPAPVGFVNGGTVLLNAPEARFGGGIRYAEGHGWAHDWLTNWTTPTDSMSWSVDARQPARYVAYLRYTCPPAAVGSTVRLSVNGQSVTGNIAPAFDPPLLSSPDRVPRKEAFEKPWARLKLGTLAVPKGETRLVLRATRVPNGHVADVKAIELEPVAPAR